MPAKDSRGFSLLELLIVVALAAALAGLAVPGVQRSLSSSQLAASANVINAELNFARTIAVSRNAIFEILISPEQGTIQVIDPEDPQNPPRVPKRLDSNISFVGLPGSTIRFFPRGHSSSGVITLGDDYGQVLNIQVSQAGMVEVEGYDSYGY